MDFTIDRTKWYRGHGSSESRLLRNDGMMCCLGQVSLQCGYTPEDILDIASPGGVFKEHNYEANPAFSWLTDSTNEFLDSKLAGQAMLVNDEECLDDETREASLVSIFAEAGHTLTFHDGPALQAA